MVDVEQAVDEADRLIMAKCTPDLMSVDEAMDYLEQVANRCKEARNALREMHDEE